MMRKSVIRRLSKRVPALDECGEALRRVIERVDEDYAFGRPALEAPAEPKRPVIDPKLLVSASSFGIKALDYALADLSTPECVRGWLGEPRLQSWLAGLRRNRPTGGREGGHAHRRGMGRVDPASREDDAEDEAPADWRRMAWPIRSRHGTCSDMGAPDQWEAEFERRLLTIQRRDNLTLEAKRRLVHAVLDANRELLADLRERGHGAAVEAVQGAFEEALGGGGAGFAAVAE